MASSRELRDELFSTSSSRATDSRRPSGAIDEIRSSTTATATTPHALQSIASSMQYANETLQVLSQQGEQLSNASDLMSTQDYMLSRSDRILKGMGSWSGWLANKLTTETYVDPTSRAAIEAKERIRKAAYEGSRSSSEPPSYASGASSSSSSSSSSQLSPVPPLYSYYGSSPSLIKAVDGLNSYRANVLLLLSSCASNFPQSDGHTILMEVCDSLHDSLTTSLSDAAGDSHASESERDELDRLRSFARVLNAHVREVEYNGGRGSAAVSEADRHLPNRSHSFYASESSAAASYAPTRRPPVPSSSSSSSSSGQSSVRVLLEKQDQEIEEISRGLTNLKDMGVAISGALQDQHVVINNLNTLSTELDLKSRRVIRRAARLNRAGSNHPGVFTGWCTLKILYRSDFSSSPPGGAPSPRVRYLTVAPDDSLRVTSISGVDPSLSAVVGRRRDDAVFAMYVRTEVGCTNAVSLVSALSGRYVGQNFWGGFACKGTAFGTSEEWELVDDETGVEGYEAPSSAILGGGGSNKRIVSRLLSASAQWGKGAFVRWKPRDDEATNTKREQESTVALEEGAIAVCSDPDDGTDATVFGVDFIDYAPLGRAREDEK